MSTGKINSVRSSLMRRMYSIVEMMSVLAVNIDDDKAKELIEQLKKSTNVRLFDCITFFDGLDILELRLNILDPYFDYFIIVEASKTHAGEPKSLYFHDNRERFKKFEDKIIYVLITDMPSILQEGNSRADLASFQRNQIKLGLVDCRDSDIIFISDFDEIPNPLKLPYAIKLLNLGISKVRFKQELYYYYLNGRMPLQPWLFGTVCTKYKTLREQFDLKPDMLRPSEISIDDIDCPLLKNGGWHFSYIGGLDAILRKISSFEMTSLDRPESKDQEDILAKISRGDDLFGRHDHKINYESLDEGSYPKYLLDNREKFRHLLKDTAS
ncbi:MAG: hypothetical protein LUQ26_09870 [Methylococcaceae bacterium]|nr:hypothetical protein [Methylococcaceae bacterium]